MESALAKATELTGSLHRNTPLRVHDIVISLPAYESALPSSKSSMKIGGSTALGTSNWPVMGWYVPCAMSLGMTIEVGIILVAKTGYGSVSHMPFE